MPRPSPLRDTFVVQGRLRFVSTLAALRLLWYHGSALITDVICAICKAAPVVWARILVQVQVLVLR